MTLFEIAGEHIRCFTYNFYILYCAKEKNTIGLQVFKCLAFSKSYGIINGCNNMSQPFRVSRRFSHI